MNDDRIKAAQDEIERILTPRPEYVVNTAEFKDVKSRLEMIHARRKGDTEDPNRPRLRPGPGTRTGPVDESSDEGKAQTNSDERPTLKRRDE